jgi:hypothetical protein
MVGSVTTATGWQARLRVGWKDCRKRSQPEQQNQKNGEYTPHRRFFVYGNQAASVKFRANALRQRTSECCVIHSTDEKDSLCPKSTYHVRRYRFPYKVPSVAPAIKPGSSELGDKAWIAVECCLQWHRPRFRPMLCRESARKCRTTTWAALRLRIPECTITDAHGQTRHRPDRRPSNSIKTWR